jgi:hypothetical protein
MKTYKLRDSATSFLKKMGIPAKQYNLFISKRDGMHFVDDVKAQEWLEDNTSPIQEPSIKMKAQQAEDKKLEKKIAVEKKSEYEAPSKHGKEVPKFVKVGGKKIMVHQSNTTIDEKKPVVKTAKKSSAKLSELNVTKVLKVGPRCCELIKQGKSNDEVWVVIQKEYQMSDDKKHYPGWWRSWMKRNDK